MQTLEATGTGRRLVLVRSADEKVIGTVLLFKFDAGSARLEVGYAFGSHRSARGSAARYTRKSAV
jgi:ribosomal-protein-alanine N-acetyltransferase